MIILLPEPVGPTNMNPCLTREVSYNWMIFMIHGACAINNRFFVISISWKYIPQRPTSPWWWCLYQEPSYSLLWREPLDFLATLETCGFFREHEFFLMSLFIHRNHLNLHSDHWQHFQSNSVDFHPKYRKDRFEQVSQLKNN